MRIICKMAQVSFLQCTSPSKWSHPSSLAKIPLYPHFCRKGNFCRMANINYLYEKSLYPAHKPFCDEHSPLSPFRCTIYPLWGKTYLTWGGKIRARCPEICRGRENGVTEKVQSLVDPICFVWEPFLLQVLLFSGLHLPAGLRTEKTNLS